ncbi:MAG: hypothetical protein ACLFSY_03620 [Desulfonatronovibrionaceae bacterium]
MSAEIKDLKQEVQELNSQMAACESRVNELRTQEDPAAGVFYHQEIFSLQQEKLRLQVEIEFREKKINRLLLEA